VMVTMDWDASVGARVRYERDLRTCNLRISLVLRVDR